MKLLTRIKTRELTSYIDDPEKYRFYVMELFRVLGIFPLLYFTVDDILSRRYDEAIFTGIIVLFFIISFPLQKYVILTPWVYRVGIGLLAANFLYLLLRSTDPYLPPLWFLLIPVVVAFLFNSIESIIWIIVTGVLAFFLVQSKGNLEQSVQSYYGRLYFLYFGIGTLSIISDYIREIIQKKYIEIQKEIIRANEKISSQVVTDSLTGIYNREFLSSDVPKFVQNAIINNTPLAVVLFDIDQFKSINDELGHPSGDQVLKEIALLCSDLLRRSTDFLVRYGGDEFLAVLEGTTLTEAWAIAERMRMEIEQETFTNLGISLTGSFGVAQLLDDDCGQGEEKAISKLITRADKNLYQAKALGKNQVVGYQPQDFDVCMIDERRKVCES